MLNSPCLLMEPVKQVDSLGCGVACVAYILKARYQKSIRFFANGRKKAKATGFLCKEIVAALDRADLKYEYKYIKCGIKSRIYLPGTIVFLGRSRKYPKGHYLVRSDNNEWMDPWINFPSEPISAGFRLRLPERPIYAIFPTKERVGS